MYLKRQTCSLVLLVTFIAGAAGDFCFRNRAPSGRFDRCDDMIPNINTASQCCRAGGAGWTEKKNGKRCAPACSGNEPTTLPPEEEPTTTQPPAEVKLCFRTREPRGIMGSCGDLMGERTRQDCCRQGGKGWTHRRNGKRCEDACQGVDVFSGPTHHCFSRLNARERCFQSLGQKTKIQCCQDGGVGWSSNSNGRACESACEKPPRPVHGGWGDWRNAGECSATCYYEGRSVYRHMRRRCNNPVPQYGGNDCRGPARKNVVCLDLPHCPDIVNPFVNLTVLVLADESPDGDPILSSAFVRTFVSDPISKSGTREHRRARTADNGMVVLECPHNESIIVTANDADYFANSVSFRCNLHQTNAVTLPLHRPYEDTLYIYHPESPRVFGSGNETLNERYSTYFPEDIFDIPDNRRLQLLFRSVNVSLPNELELVPEMITCIPEIIEIPGRRNAGVPPQYAYGVNIRAIETFGAMELTVIEWETRRVPSFKDDRKMVLTFPIQKLPADLSVGDKVSAWTFKFESGCWEEDGEGELVIDERTGNLVWRYEANHFSWWAAGRVNRKTSCVTVRTCYDKNCSHPAPDTLVRIFGEDYGFETFRYTNMEGQTCVQFPYGRTVELSSPCTSEAIDVDSTENPSSCDEGRFKIPNVPYYQLEEPQDSCREAVLVIPEYERSCPQPEEVHNNLALD